MSRFVFSVCVLAAMVIGSAVEAASIGINFRRASNGNTSMLSTDTAGFVPQQNWNNAAAQNSGDSGTTPADIVGGVVVDSDGNSTSLEIAWSANTSWETNYSGSGDAKLFDGYIDDTGGAGNTDITLSNIPYEQFDLYVYVGSDGGGRTGNVAVNGGTPIWFNTFGNQGGGVFPGYVQATSLTAAGAVQAGPSNYVLFQGLSASAIAVTRGSNNVGVHGFQIIDTTPPVPEPATAGLALMAVGALGAGLRRRRA